MNEIHIISEGIAILILSIIEISFRTLLKGSHTAEVAGKTFLLYVAGLIAVEKKATCSKMAEKLGVTRLEHFQCRNATLLCLCLRLSYLSCSLLYLSTAFWLKLLGKKKSYFPHSCWWRRRKNEENWLRENRVSPWPSKKKAIHRQERPEKWKGKG